MIIDTASTVICSSPYIIIPTTLATDRELFNNLRTNKISQDVRTLPVKTDPLKI
jgi:hypothetical protein